MHTEWTDRFSAYLDGELDDAARRRVEAHLAACAECARILADLRRVVGWASEYPGRAPDRDEWPAIRANFERWLSEDPPTVSLRELNTAP